MSTAGSDPGARETTTELVAARSLVEDVAALRSGGVSLAAYIDQLCDRIGDVESQLSAYVSEPHRRSRLHADAANLERRWPDVDTRPSLFGAAVAVKDIMNVDGFPTRAGSTIDPALLAGSQAVIVDRLRAAGALVIGKSVTAEFASAAPGPTRNPHDPTRTPGGSSSGSAAAIAAGTAALALGTQTIGSVVRPAAYCGIVGFKPTYGRIATGGVLAHSPSFDTPGVFASDVDGVALAASVVWDRWEDPPPLPASAEPRRLAVPTGAYLDRADDEARNGFDADCARLSAVGYVVLGMDLLPDLAEVLHHNEIINRYELAQTHARWFDEQRAHYRTETVDAIEFGRRVTAEQYAASLQHLEGWRRGLDERMVADEVDAVVAPGATGPAPAGIGHTGDPSMALPWTYGGLPAISVPTQRSSRGLPLGLQLVGRRGGDEALLSLAECIAPVLRTP